MISSRGICRRSLGRGETPGTHSGLRAGRGGHQFASDFKWNILYGCYVCRWYAQHGLGALRQGSTPRRSSAAHYSDGCRFQVCTSAADIFKLFSHQVERDRPSKRWPPTARVIATVNSQERLGRRDTHPEDRNNFWGLLMREVVGIEPVISGSCARKG
eukprot:6198787-Pleurochrysis_carterae.AAC.1